MKTTWIINGTIYDGTGAEPYMGSIAIQGDRIVQIVKGAAPESLKSGNASGLKNSNAPGLESGAKTAHARKVDAETAEVEVIDALGLNVTPGFIDIHRHCDIRPFYGTDYGKVMLAQGITTTVVGNCGFSMTPVPEDPVRAREMQDYAEPVVGPAYQSFAKREAASGKTEFQKSGLRESGLRESELQEIKSFTQYMKALEACRLPVNTASMVGTGTVKIAVKGFDDGPYTETEMAQAVGYIKEALEQGAVGVSAGIMYLPECYSTTDEYARMLAVMQPYGVPLCVHIRGEGDSLVDSVREVIEIGRKVGCPVEISHFKSCGMANWRRKIHEAIALIEEARAAGQDVTCDFYPYEGGSTTLVTMVPPAYVNGDMNGALARLGTPEGVEAFVEALNKEYADWDNYAVTLGWDRILISGVTKAHNRKWVGMTVAEAAQKRGLTDGELVAELLHDEDGKVAIINMSMCQEDIDTVARLPYSNVISDSIYADTDTPHPRMYGAFPKVIREYVKERKVLTMEEAIRKMTSQPAQRMGITERGLLKEGYYADINIWADLRDTAVWENPTRLAVGLERSYVNGTLAWMQDTMINDNGGRVIRRNDNGRQPSCDKEERE